FEEIANTKHVALLKHRRRPHYFIRISPAMDQFILDSATELGINLQDYGLPSTLEELTSVTKDVKAKSDNRFKILFKAIKDAHEMMILHTVLNYLNSNTYQSKVEKLKQIFAAKQ
ncbi:MAG: hypothetical protein IJT97_04920, partial [Bacteroidaceae bacterium]|nr:hypothetical protein [Bacteroidaceae bacterium]